MYAHTRSFGRVRYVRAGGRPLPSRRGVVAIFLTTLIFARGASGARKNIGSYVQSSLASGRCHGAPGAKPDTIHLRAQVAELFPVGNEC
jgi:hypothetical protein